MAQKMQNLKQLAPTMEGKKVFMLAQYRDQAGLMQTEAIKMANHLGARILSNKEFDQRLVLSDRWKPERDVYPAWTGTLVAFKGKYAKLGGVVKYTDSHSGITHIFEVPIEYQNEKNAILVVNHCFLANGNALIIPNENKRTITYDIADKSKIALIQNFPTSYGWYDAPNKFCVPTGKDISSSHDFAYYLFRDPSYVGLLVRGCEGFREIFLRGVGAGWNPSLRQGVLITAPKKITE